MRIDPKNATEREARRTAFVVAAVLAVVTAWLIYQGGITLPAIMGAAALILVIVGTFLPSAAKVFHRGWMTFAFALGYVNSRIILTLVYFLVFVPYGLVSRLLGRDPLDMRSIKRKSYWHKREKTRPDREQFERLF